MYRIDGDMLVSVSGDRMRLVGRIGGDGCVKYEPGMQSAHRRKVEEWLEAGCPSASAGGEAGATSSPPFVQTDSSAAGEEGSSSVSPVRHVSPRKEEADGLPPFSRQFGTATPGFVEWVAAQGLSDDDVAALVRRLERM